MRIIMKNLITNPVYKCLRIDRNPFLLLDIYEHFDLYQEVKTAYDDVYDHTKNQLEISFGALWATKPIASGRWQRDNCKKLRNQLSTIENNIKTLNDLSKVLTEDELMTYELL